MSLLGKLTEELKAALKAHDKFRVNTLRMLISQLKNAQINAGTELSPEQELDEIISAAKKRKESIQAYQAGGRQDLFENEQTELEIIKEFLPKQMSESEVEHEIEKVIQETGATSIKDLGKVMGEVMARLKGKADGKKVQAMVRAKLI
ncbi:MAG TPA: GatB/YqeY domain-containing protein [bacterium]|nr:GatB/YqeY domain-containing protein [bacterium]